MWCIPTQEGACGEAVDTDKMSAVQVGGRVKSLEKASPWRNQTKF